MRAPACAYRSHLAAALTIAVALLAAHPADAKKAPKKFLGVVPADVPAATEFPRMAQGGAASVRFLMHWAVSEPTAGGGYDWTQSDHIIGNAAQSGLTVLPFFYGTPAWAGGCSSADPALCERYLPIRSAIARSRWSAFLKAAVTRYGPKGTFWTDPTDAYDPPYRPVRTWQIWNEANSPTFTKPKPSVKAYWRLLRLSAASIRAADPRARIMLTGLFGTPPKPGIPMWTFLDKLYALKGAKKLFDGVALHPYSPNLRGIIYQVRRGREIMDRNGDRKTGLWLTELGSGSARRTSAPGGSGRLLLGSGGQARLLRKSFKALITKRKRYRIRGIYWFAWKDVPPGAGGACYLCESAGLFTYQSEAKPAWRAFTRFAGGKP